MADELPGASETFDAELLGLLGDEPAPARERDAQRIHAIEAEFAMGFNALGGIGPAVSVFGSARTPREHPYYGLAREVGAVLGRAGDTARFDLRPARCDVRAAPANPGSRD